MDMAIGNPITSRSGIDHVAVILTVFCEQVIACFVLVISEDSQVRCAENCFDPGRIMNAVVQLDSVAFLQSIERQQNG
jgi:hypothetical protein